jgi:rhodanese-related sulfurtransferase
MANWMSHLTLNQRLAGVALALGAVALFASPYQGSTVRVDTAALATELATGADRVAPRELAAWILGGRADYRLIDMRSEADFARDRIPTAENIPAAGLLTAGLFRNEKIIIYGDDGVQSAQAWLLLRANGYRGARLLEGGITAWQERVVSPVLTENPTPEQKAENDKLTAIAAYFGGVPRVGGVAVAPFLSAAPAGAAVPRVAPPAVPAGAGKPAPRKKREGC